MCRSSVPFSCLAFTYPRYRLLTTPVSSPSLTETVCSSPLQIQSIDAPMRFLLGHSMPLSCQCDIFSLPGRREGGEGGRSLASFARSLASTHSSFFGSLHNVSSRVSSKEHAVTVVIRAVVWLRFSEMYVASKFVAHKHITNERWMGGRTLQMACGCVCGRSFFSVSSSLHPAGHLRSGGPNLTEHGMRTVRKGAGEL